jgi:hypothetical protein
MERRKQNVQNYGHSWIKPPGIPKSLYQLREERREMEEHQEVLRREALAQELAEAEAEGAEELLMLQGEGGDELDEPRDLDDDVPEADITGLDAEESEPDDDDDDDDDDDEDSELDIEEVPRGVLAGRMPEDAYREALVRGEQPRTSRFGDDGGSTVGEEEMLQEEDLVHESRLSHADLDMDADVNLDDEIPEAEETGGYEHTDTEAELSSSDDDESVDGGVFPSRGYAAASSMVRSDGTQNSMDIGGMISQSSSQMGSSPRRRRSDIRAR